MRNIVYINLIMGFTVVLLSAFAGAFLGLAVTNQFLYQDGQASWALTLSRSAHGHLNLFGYLHILFALTTKYSSSSYRTKKIQTVLLFLGTLGIGPGLWFRSFFPLEQSLGWLTYGIGLLISLGCMAMVWHLYELVQAFAERKKTF